MHSTAQIVASLDLRYSQAIAAATESFEASKLEIEQKARRICNQFKFNGDVSNWGEMVLFASQNDSNFKAKFDHQLSMYSYLDHVSGRYTGALEAYNAKPNFTLLSRLHREVNRAEHFLPTHLHRQKIELAVSLNRFVVVQGEAGAGKSTQIPQYLADMDEFQESIILCTQPSRIAAQTLAKRVAKEFRAGFKLPSQSPDLVCYASSWAQISAFRPHICYLTESTFLSLLTSQQADLIFERIRAVVIDDVHERTIQTDMILGLLKASTLFYHVKVIALSSDVGQVSVQQYFRNCQLVEINTKEPHVETVAYTDTDSNYFMYDIVEEALKQVRKIIRHYPPGDILCFLTTEYEVEKAKQRLRLLNDPSIIALCMHGRQDADDMDAVFEPAPSNKQKVIFATDIAETSLPIAGLSYVIDMGLCTSLVYSGQGNINTLRVMPISRRSANLRKGHLGRAKHGVYQCFRMYSKRQFDQFDEEKKPGILQHSLDVTSAYLLSLNVDPFKFPWLNAPDFYNLLRSFDSLKTHGAISSTIEPPCLPAVASNVLTPLGHLLASLQIDAGFVAGIDYANKQGILETGIILASVAAHSDVILYSGGKEYFKLREDYMKHVKSGGEMVAYFKMYLHWHSLPNHRQRSKWCVDTCVNSKTMFSIYDNVLEMQGKIKAFFPINSSQRETTPDQVPTALLQKVLLCMMKDKFAVQLRPNEFLVFGSETDKRGVTASLHPSSLLFDGVSQKHADAQWVVFHTLLTTNRAYLMQLTPVTREMVVDVCGKYHADLMQRWTGNSRLLQIIKHPVSPRIQIELIGQHGCKKEALMNELL